MGVDYRAVVAIGQEFYDSGEVVDFLQSSAILSEDDEDYLNSSVAEFLDDNMCGIEGSCLNMYNGNHWYVGYEINCSSPEAFEKSYKESIRKWEELFPNEKYEVINTVMVY